MFHCVLSVFQPKCNISSNKWKHYSLYYNKHAKIALEILYSHKTISMLYKISTVYFRSEKKIHVLKANCLQSVKHSKSKSTSFKSISHKIIYILYCKSCKSFKQSLNLASHCQCPVQTGAMAKPKSGCYLNSFNKIHVSKKIQRLKKIP